MTPVLRNNAEVTRDFVQKGWEIRYRGGNELCSTPSDLGVIVADAPGPTGSRPRYSIAAWPAADGPDGKPRPFTFDLYDAERDVGTRITHVPTPEQAVKILEGIVAKEMSGARQGEV